MCPKKYENSVLYLNSSYHPKTNTNNTFGLNSIPFGCVEFSILCWFVCVRILLGNGLICIILYIYINVLTVVHYNFLLIVYHVKWLKTFQLISVLPWLLFRDRERLKQSME